MLLFIIHALQPQEKEMIFIGKLEILAAEYRATWSGLCRGNPRGTYEIGAEGLSLRSDFIRWLKRQAIKNKEEIMVLVQRIEKPGTTVLVFEGNDEGKTVEHLVAEVICRLGMDGQGVSSWALHFASMHHPFSTTQRLRELADKYRIAWLAANPPDLFGCTGRIYDGPYRFIKSESKYYFNQEFVAWLRQEYIEKGPANVPAN